MGELTESYRGKPHAAGSDRGGVSAGRETKRIFWLDAVRVLAIVSVCCNHAMHRSFLIYADTRTEYEEMGVLLSFVKAALYVFSRVGVPLFLMLTGALLMKRDYSDRGVLKRFVRDNWWPLLRTTLIWLAIMYAYLSFSGNSYLHTEGPGSALAHFIANNLFLNQSSRTTMGSMWYMPMILCLYLMIPVMSQALRHLDNRYLCVLCAAVVLSAMVLPDLNAALAAGGVSWSLRAAFSHTDLFSVYMVYVLAGYWVSSGCLERLRTRTVIIFEALSFAATAAFQCWSYSTESNYYVRYADVGVLAASVFLFECFRRCAGKSVSVRRRRIVTALSKMSFGIYFVHICAMTGIKHLLSYMPDIRGFGLFFILAAVSFMVSVLLIHFLSRNRYLRKYLFLIKG